jgi:hypothetical protein
VNVERTKKMTKMDFNWSFSFIFTASRTAIYDACDIYNNFEVQYKYEDQDTMNVQECMERCVQDPINYPYVIMQVRLNDYLRFYVSLENISLICKRHHWQWRAAKFRPMLGAQGLWSGRDLYRATPGMTHDLSFSGLTRRATPFSRLLQHSRECWEPIPTRGLVRDIISCVYQRIHDKYKFSLFQMSVEFHWF